MARFKSCQVMGKRNRNQTSCQISFFGQWNFVSQQKYKNWSTSRFELMRKKGPCVTKKESITCHTLARNEYETSCSCGIESVPCQKVQCNMYAMHGQDGPWRN